jgi:hypothetical protein
MPSSFAMRGTRLFVFGFDGSFVMKVTLEKG